MAADRRPGLHRWLYGHFGRAGSALYTLITAFVAVASSGLVAYLLGQPLILLALAPTAVLFFKNPLDQSASPRSAIVGHSVAMAAGLLSLAIFGLLDEPGATRGGFSLTYVVAGILATALTAALMKLVRAWHLPAGTTAGLVSLGFFDTLRGLLAIAVGVVLITAAGWLINRVLGVPVPLWSEEHERPW